MKSLQLQVFDMMKFPKTLGKLPKDIYTDREYAMLELWSAFRKEGVIVNKERKVIEIKKANYVIGTESYNIYTNTLPNGKTVKDLLPYVQNVIGSRIKSISIKEIAPFDGYKIVFNNNAGMTLNPFLLADIAYKIQGDEAIKPIKEKVVKTNEISPNNSDFMGLMKRFTNTDISTNNNFIFFSENQVFALDGPTFINFNHNNSINDIGAYTDGDKNNTWVKGGNDFVLSRYKNIVSQIDDFTLKSNANVSFSINRKALVDTLKQISQIFKSKDFSEMRFGGMPDIYLEMYPNMNKPNRGKLTMTISNAIYGHLIVYDLPCFYSGKAFIKILNPLLLLKVIDTFKSDNEKIEIILNEARNCFAIHDECKYGKYEAVVCFYKDYPSGRNSRKDKPVEKDKNGKIIIEPSDYDDVYLPKKQAIAKFNENYTPVEFDEKIRLIALKYKYAKLAQKQELELLELLNLK